MDLFAVAVDVQTEIKGTFLHGSAFADDAGQLAKLKLSWREVCKALDTNLDKKPNTLDEDMDAPRPGDAGQHRGLLSEVLQQEVPLCEARGLRQFLKQLPSVLRVSRVRSRAEGSMVQRTMRQRISEYVSLEFAEVGFDDSAVPHGFMHCFVALRTLGTTWCVAGHFIVGLGEGARGLRARVRHRGEYRAS